MRHESGKQFLYRSYNRSPREKEIGSSLLVAINHLKETEQKIDSTERKLKVLERRRSKKYLEELEEQRRLRMIDTVLNCVQDDKSERKKVEETRKHELRERLSLNLSHKIKNKQVLEKVRRTFLEINHKTSEEVKRKHAENEEMIKKLKEEHLREKRELRLKEILEEKQRRNSIQHFYDNKIKELRELKYNEADRLFQHAGARYRYLEHISNEANRLQPMEGKKNSVFNPELSSFEDEHSID